MVWFDMVGTERHRRGMRIPAKEPLSIVRGQFGGHVMELWCMRDVDVTEADQ